MSEETTVGKGQEILVVDDDEFVCNSLKWLLIDEGYDVEVCTDGKSALHVLSKHNFDLVLTDLMMPEVDGLMVLQEVKRISPNTAVIILTGYGTLESAMAALREGAYDFLTKPCNDGEMKYKIQGALEQRHRRENRHGGRAAGTVFRTVRQGNRAHAGTFGGRTQDQPHRSEAEIR